MRLLFFGSGAFGVPTLRNLQQNHEVAAVITQPDRPSGRGRKLTPTPIKQWATELGLEVIEVDDVNDPAIARQLTGLAADVGVVLAFGQKIGPELLAGLKGECINAHASLLPKYRGAAPFQWAILNGEEQTGVTVFKLVARMDAGPILTTRRTVIKEDETAEELHDRLAAIAVDAMGGALELYAERANPPGEPQDESAATPAPKLRKVDGHLDFGKSAAELNRLIRGMWHWPGARCKFVSADGTQEQEVLLARARIGLGAGENLPPGGIDSVLQVGTGEGVLEILEIKPAGGKRMTWQAYVNGRHVRAGDRLQNIDT